MKVSVVLPTFNEAGNIVALVNDILAKVPADWEPEIWVVDDASPDGTFELARTTFAGRPEVKTILRTEDHGLAASIRAGVDAATGDQILVMDTDFTHDPIEIPKMLHVSGVYDVVIGSRFCSGGNMQDTVHYLTSLYYNRVLRVLLRTQVQDSLGGYFTMPLAALRSLPLNEIFYGYGDYFFRLLYHVRRAGFSIVEVPAIYRARTAGESKSNPAKMIVSYTGELTRLAWSAYKERRRERKKGT